MCPQGSKIGFRNPIFDDFLSSKYDISRTVGPISMIFSAKWWQFNSLFRLKKKLPEKFKLLKKFKNFAVSADFRFLGRQLGFRFFFRIFEISLDYAFLDWKGHKIVSSLQKTSEKLDQRFWRYRTSKKKYYWNFAACGFGTLIFGPWGHKWAPIFVFMCYFCSVIRNKELDISQGVFALLFWKIEFFNPILHYCQFLQNQPLYKNERL